MTPENNFDRFLKVLITIICLPLFPLWFCFIYIQRLLESSGNEYPETARSSSEEESESSDSAASSQEKPGKQFQRMESTSYPTPRGMPPRRPETTPFPRARAPTDQMQRISKTPVSRLPSSGKQIKKNLQEPFDEHTGQRGEDYFVPEKKVSKPIIKAGKEAAKERDTSITSRKPDLDGKGSKGLERQSESSQEHKGEKDDIYNLKSMKMDLSEFEALDAYACKVPPRSSVSALVEDLLLYASTNLEKIRAIWMWICCHIEYDVKGYHNKDKLHSGPEDVLKTGKAVCAGYSGLFCQMCSIAAVECTEISGYSKGYNYEIGKKFKGDSDHAWNAVFLEGKWHLLDSTWGAGHVNDTCTKFTRKYVEFYFFTHPSLFINNHFPMEEKWQLITPRISLKIFEDMVFRTGDFFEMGLMYIHPDVQLISTVNGRAIVSIEGHSPTLFMYSLDERKDCAILTLTKYGMKLEVLPQKRGDHKLKIYAKPWDSDSETYTFICAYLIKCESVDENFKLPKAFHNPMGPSWLTEMKGLLQPSHPEPLVYCNDGQCTMRFLVNKELSFTSKLSCDEVNLSDEVMRNHVFKMHLGNWVEFKIHLPQSGLYVFAIFAKDKGSQSPSHAHVCEYFISCANRNVHWPGFPKIFSSWTDGCELVEPLAGILPPNQMVKFKLKIPHVRKVQVSGKGACPLSMSKDGYWEGSCNTQDVKHLNVAVSDKMFDNKFTFALQYEVGDV